MASFEIHRDMANGEWRFSGCITEGDLQDLRLDHVDQAVVGSPALNVADQLQSLEIIFRRIGEQQK